MWGGIRARGRCAEKGPHADLGLSSKRNPGFLICKMVIISAPDCRGEETVSVEQLVRGDLSRTLISFLTRRGPSEDG